MVFPFLSFSLYRPLGPFLGLWCLLVLRFYGTTRTWSGKEGTTSCGGQAAEVTPAYGNPRERLQQHSTLVVFGTLTWTQFGPGCRRSEDSRLLHGGCRNISRRAEMTRGCSNITTTGSTTAGSTMAGSITTGRTTAGGTTTGSTTTGSTTAGSTTTGRTTTGRTTTGDPAAAFLFACGCDLPRTGRESSGLASERRRDEQPVSFEAE